MDGLVVRVAVLGLGVAMSPVPVVGVLVILLGRRARLGGLAVAGAWVLGSLVAIGIAIAFAGTITPPRQGYDLPFEGMMAALLGAGMVLLAWLARRGRLRSENPHATPDWANAVDMLSPTGGALVAFTNATTSPKNLALAIVAGSAIQEAMTLTGGLPLAEVLVYVGAASLTVVVPVVVYFAYGKRAETTLADWRRFVSARAAAILEISMLGLGIVLMFKGLYNLFG
jgi:hypothetical protein